MRFEFDDDDLVGMPWPANETAIQGADYVVLPTGSTEQHSTHLPTFVDSIRAAELSRELATAAPDHGLDLKLLPTLPFGESEHHMGFPGTVTLSPDTYQDVVVDIGASMADHGASRLLLLNCHGGNREPLSLAADRIEREYDLTTHFVHWTDYAREALVEAFGEGWGHAGEHETSVIAHYYPALVDEGAAEPQTVHERPETRSVTAFDEVTEEGGLGDPTAADSELIEGIIASTTASILEALAEDL